MGLGITAGGFVVHTIAPPSLPEADTREDSILMADLNARIDNEFKVKVLRGKCLGMAKQLKGQEGGWAEIVASTADAEGKKDDNENLINTLRGAKSLGVERVFYNRRDQSLVAVIWFGGALCGWPGVTHGGAIATALGEKLTLAAALASYTNDPKNFHAGARPQRMPGTGDHAKMYAPLDLPEEPKQLSMSYAKPTYANSFYVVRVKPASEVVDEKGTLAQFEPLGGAEYEATLETLDAAVCVRARARFAASTVVQRTEEAVQNGAREGYEGFKEWMWPSRQKSSQGG